MVIGGQYPTILANLTDCVELTVIGMFPTITIDAPASIAMVPSGQFRQQSVGLIE